MYYRCTYVYGIIIGDTNHSWKFVAIVTHVLFDTVIGADYSSAALGITDIRNVYVGTHACTYIHTCMR
jgi:hypothetical protein